MFWVFLDLCVNTPCGSNKPYFLALNPCQKFSSYSPMLHHKFHISQLHSNITHGVQLLQLGASKFLT